MSTHARAQNYVLMRFKSLEDIAAAYGVTPPGAQAPKIGGTPLLDKLEITLENCAPKSWKGRERSAPDYYLTDQQRQKTKQLAQDQNLRNRANSKNLSHTLAAALMQLPTAHNLKAYANTFFCASYIVAEENRFKSKYCRNRWCLVCNRIKTAYYIDLYTPHLNTWKDKYLVTLTAPTIKKEDLKEEIQLYLDAFVRIKDKMRKQNEKIKGIRKLEITYNPVKKLYHPHFHIIIEGENHANNLRDNWLKAFPNANIKAQDVQPANANSLKEVFKYFTKITADNKNEPTITLPALDAIFAAVKGRRVFQSFGFKTKQRAQVTDEELNFYRDLLAVERETVKATSKQIDNAQPQAEVYLWNAEAGNYLNYGEPLTDYNGTTSARDFAKRIIFTENQLSYEKVNKRCKPRRYNKRHALADKGLLTVCAPMG
jgi:hypothetical protein